MLAEVMTFLLQVLDVIAESVHLFDEVNVATALHRLAKLQSQGQGNQARSFIATEQFKLLVAAIRRLLPRFEAQVLMYSTTCIPFPSNVAAFFIVRPF